MLAQRLRHRIRIEEPIESQGSGDGELTVTWRTVSLGGSRLSSVPAEVLTAPGKESVGAGTILAETTAQMTFRWFPGLTQKMRVVWDGKTYNITGIATDSTGRKEYQITCGGEGVNTG